MSESFGAAALGLSGLAARLLGWRPADFWAATPAELAAALMPSGGIREGVTRQELEHMVERNNDCQR